MRRRVVYVLISIVTVNLVLMAVLFVRAPNTDTCDTNARGLAIWDDDRDGWLQVSAPLELTDLPPCKGILKSELKVLPS